jgi:hypothetical protein
MPKSKKQIKKASSQNNRSLTLNATSIRRSPTTFQIDPNKLVVPDWMTEDDPVFVGLYKKYLLGRISAFATRVPIEMIKEGFYLPSRNFEYLCDTPPEDVIRDQILRIQKGARPPLHLYSNLNMNCNFRFLCPDDVAPCVAYKRLNVRCVPAIVFSPGKKSLPFSSFESKVYAATGGMEVQICGLISADAPSKLYTCIEKVFPKDPLDILKIISDVLRTLVARLRLFHIYDSNQLHYHHMIFSAVVRMQETLTAIEVLIEKNLWHQALALLRVLYEIHLNFYFDWLQPETNYKFLAAAAVFNSAAVVRQKKLMSQDLVTKGITLESAAEQANIAWRPVILASTVSEKARLSKVGILYHKAIYDFLSQVSHQNFEIASLHANRFDDETFKAVSEDVKMTYLRFMDYIVSEFVVCVNQDIGTSPY